MEREGEYECEREGERVQRVEINKAKHVQHLIYFQAILKKVKVNAETKLRIAN